MRLSKLDELFRGLNPCLAILCSILAKAKNGQDKALGLYVRHKLTKKDFNIDGKNLAHVANGLEQALKTKPADFNFSLEEREDDFGPVSEPKKEHLYFPENVKVH